MMNVSQSLCLLFLMVGTMLCAQSSEEELAQRQTLIDTLYSQEKYAEVIPLMDEQMKAIEGTVWEDTLYSYCYNYARSHWKTQGVDAGIAAANKVIDEVKKSQDPVRLIHAYSDLSWIYYEVGQVDQCLVVDSIAMTISDREGVPTFLKGRTRHYMGFNYAMKGNYNRAGDYFDKAHEIFMTLEPRDSLARQQLAESSNGIAVAAWHLGQTKKAEKHYLEALDWIGESDDLQLISRKASTLGNLALMYEDAGDLAKCKEYYNQNIQICNRIITESDDPFLRDEIRLLRTRTYGNLASLYHSLGDYSTSKGYLDLADRDRKLILEPDDPQRLVIQQSYADIEDARGNHAEAERLVRGYLESCLKHYGKNSEFTGRAYTKLALATAKQGRIAEADSLFNEAMNSYRSISSETTDPDLALTYLLRGDMRMENGDLDQARVDFERSKSIYINNLGQDNHKVINTDLELIKIDLEQENYEAALTRVEGALDKLKSRSRSKESQIGQVFQYPHLLPDALYYKVLAKRELEPNVYDRNVSLGDLQIAIEALQYNKTGLRDEESKLLLLGSQENVFNLALDIAQEVYENDRSTSSLEKVLNLSEKNKSIILKDRLNSINSISYAGVPDSIIELEQHLINSLGKESIEDHDAVQMLKTEESYAQLVDQLRSDYPAYFKLRYGDVDISIEQIRSAILNENQSLVAYALTDEKVHISVISKENAQLFSVAKGSLEEDISGLNNAIKEQDKERYILLARRLYDQLINPIKDRLTQELLIIPDGQMYYLNFEMLLTGESKEEDYSRTLMIRDYTISYLISATTALQFEDLDRSENERVLALAPGFSDEMKAEYLNTVKDSSLIDNEFIHQIQQPFAMNTASSIGRILQADVHVGNQANETTFKDRAENYGVIHMGTHTFINNKAPLYSKLILGKSDSEDGYLHAYELYDMELKAELAVLTACETGVGEMESSEGIRSIAHSFAYAGCPSIVMSLWNIDEKSSSIIIEEFYENLTRGQAKNVALRNAKLTFIEDNLDNEQLFPFYWAGLVLVGDESPMALDQGLPLSWILIGAGLLLAILLFFLINRKGQEVN